MRKYTHQDFLNKLYKCKGNEYTPLENYKGAKVKIKFKHNICNNIFKTTPDNIYYGGCPECGYKNILIFDFAIIKNKKVICLIEYQGVQHYKPIDFFGGEEVFKIQKIKDNIKRQYSKENKIPLIEVPYYIDDIEEYLISNIRKQLN